jgi:quercetin dioxygenase-like cupin family protein
MMEVTINGDRVTVREGEFGHMSPNVPHGARSIGEAVVLGVFTPIRADWKD